MRWAGVAAFLAILAPSSAQPVVPELAAAGARITGCSKRVAQGQPLCICGYFPGDAARELRLNGASAEVISANLRTVLLQTKGVVPGPVQVGLGGETVMSEVIGVMASLDRDSLWRGEATELRMAVQGTAAPVEIRLMNRTPAVVRLEPHAYQAAETSGGERNELRRSVRGLKRGDFTIDFALAGGECPCTDAREQRQVLALTADASAAPQLAAGRALAVVEITQVVALGAAMVVFDILDGASPEAKAAQLAGDPRVLLAQPNRTFTTVGQAPAVGSVRQAIRAPQPAPALMAKVQVAVVDSGADGPVKESLDFTGRGFRKEAHGTMMGALVAGVAPGVGLLSLKACEPLSPADLRALCSSAALTKALDYAIWARVDVINLSLAGPEDQLLRRMVDAARQASIAVVAAVGNAGPKSPPLYPAAWPGVLSVTAVDDRRALYAQAVRGDHVSLAAPGVDLLLPVGGGRELVASGTSLAAAGVSGLIAALAGSERKAKGVEAAGWLLETPVDLGSKGKDRLFGRGLADGCAALAKGTGGRLACK